MTPKLKATIAKRYETYKAEVLNQIDRMGLQEWGITFELDDLGDSAGGLVGASVRYDFQDLWAEFSYSDNPALHDGECDPSRDAKHEVAHLLICKLATMAEYRFITQRELTCAAEEIARRLEKVL